MIHKTKNGIYQSTLLESIPELLHGFTSKKQLSMQDEKNRNAFMLTLGVLPDRLVVGHQVHGTNIHTVERSDVGTIIEEVDGFIYRKMMDADIQPIVGIRVGDCVPLVCIDQDRHIIGAAHAGWRGTKDHIAKKLMEAFVRKGAHPSDVIVAIGPSIHPCCYQVDEARATEFEREFPGIGGIVTRTGVSWCIDLETAIIADLKQSGVREAYIDRNKELCTHCNPLEFYSYRRSEEPFGEIMGFIGYKH